MQDQKPRVGDIDVAYKMFGKGDPIILHNCASDNMDAWDPALLSIPYFDSGELNKYQAQSSYEFEPLEAESINGSAIGGIGLIWFSAVLTCKILY
jgi:hypothetical protein